MGAALASRGLSQGRSLPPSHCGVRAMAIMLGTTLRLGHGWRGMTRGVGTFVAEERAPVSNSRILSGMCVIKLGKGHASFGTC